jgi:hypothetical protein
MKLGFVVMALGWGAVLAAPAAAEAQEMSAEEIAAINAAVAPDENHALLESFVGSWNHAIQFYPAPGAEPMEMTATSVAGTEMGGRYLVTEFDGEFLGAPFEGQETMGYDKVKQRYFSLWVDNMSTGPMVAWGTYDAATKTLTMEGTFADPMSGNPEKKVRNTTQLMDDGSVHYENWGPGPDGEFYRTMVIHSTRQ